MEKLVLYLIRLTVMFIGAFNIDFAIRNFIKGNYFMVGLDVMMAVWMAAVLNDTYRSF